MDKQVIKVIKNNHCKKIIESRQKPNRKNSKIFFIQSEYRMFHYGGPTIMYADLR
jgi:hypothetical protein